MKEKKLKKEELVAQHSGPVSVLQWKDKRQKRSDNDFNLPWTGNKNEANEMWTEKQKPVSVLDYKKKTWVELI